MYLSFHFLFWWTHLFVDFQDKRRYSIPNIKSRSNHSPCQISHKFGCCCCFFLLTWIKASAALAFYRRRFAKIDLSDIEPNHDSSQEQSLATLRQGKYKDDPEPSLTLLHKFLIAPVCDLLDGPEIIIVPDRCLYRVPWPALLNESGRYLSESRRIRIIPSLTTLKLIQDSLADFHS